MKNKSLYTLLSISVIFVFIFSLFSTVNVLADDSTPPAPTEAPVVDVSPTDVPIATDVPTEGPAVQDGASVSDILAQVPEGTDIVVLDENGNPLPMASQEASDAILSDTDPMWCPAADTTVTANCVNAADVGSLLPLLASKDEDGIIYFYTPVTYNTNDVTFDGTNTDIDQLADNNLTLQGGWNGTITLGSLISFSGNSVFSVPVALSNWSGNITINNFTVNGASPSGIGISDVAGDVTLNNDTVTNSLANGAYISNTNGAGMISINNSTFSDNDFEGLYAQSNGDIVLNNVTADDNGGSGAILDNSTGSGGVTLTGTNTFNDNGVDGLTVLSTGEMFLENVTANGNSTDGIDLENCGCIDAGITLVNVIANLNGGTGAEILSSGGPVSVRNSHFENNNYDGLNIKNTNTGNSIASGNVTLIDVVASSNNWDDDDYANAYILTYGGDITVINSIFTYNYHVIGPIEWGGDGLDAFSDVGGPSNDSGEINLLGVTASYNYNVGADLENDDCGCTPTTSGIFIDSSSFDHNGDFNISNSDSRGLIAHSNGDITLANVSASVNGGGGAELENCFPSSFFSICTNTNLAQITVVNSAFNGNGYNPPDISWLFGGSGPFQYASVGLWAESTGTLTLNGVTANGNGWGDVGGGAFLLSEDGDLSISNSNFSGNCAYECDFLGFGFIGIDEGGGVTLNGVTANGNGNDILNDPSVGWGAIIFNDGGNTIIKNSNFNGNCTLDDCFGVGIFLVSIGNVYFDNVSASGNGTAVGVGAEIMSAGNVDIYCSTFSDNVTIGLGVDTSGDVTLNGVVFGGNGVEDYDISSASLTINPFDCTPKHKKDSLNLPLKVVNVSSGQSVDLDCEHFSGTKLMLENDNSMTVPCPINDSASIVDTKKVEDLPKPLPEGKTFLSAFTTSVSKKGEKLGKLLESFATISFVIPEGTDISKLAILFWDGSQWIDVKNTYVRNDPITGKSYFEAYVTDLGTFVLVQK
jgi:hypothetical protein